MIPALLAIPMVQGVVGGLVGGVMNAFAPSAPETPSAPTTSSSTGSAFNPYLAQATSAGAQESSPIASPCGSMRSDEWSQMGTSDVKSWATSLAGKHVDAIDATGRTISGLVGGMQMLGNTLALNIGGHLVSLSQLKQVRWSPAV